MTGPDRADDATVGAPPPTPPPPPGRRRDHRFRARLLEKLPLLGVADWSAKDDFRVDEEWSGIVSLGSDAILGPLEPLAPDRREG
jgi:hypothetical protein